LETAWYRSAAPPATTASSGPLTALVQTGVIKAAGSRPTTAALTPVRARRTSLRPRRTSQNWSRPQTSRKDGRKIATSAILVGQFFEDLGVFVHECEVW
jgi:hypothetical protein